MVRLWVLRELPQTAAMLPFEPKQGSCLSSAAPDNNLNQGSQRSVTVHSSSCIGIFLVRATARNRQSSVSYLTPTERFRARHLWLTQRRPALRKSPKSLHCPVADSSSLGLMWMRRRTIRLERAFEIGRAHV